MELTSEQRDHLGKTLWLKIEHLDPEAEVYDWDAQDEDMREIWRLAAETVVQAAVEEGWVS